MREKSIAFIVAFIAKFIVLRQGGAADSMNNTASGDNAVSSYIGFAIIHHKNATQIKIH
jgi:hypothetical protein